MLPLVADHEVEVAERERGQRRLGLALDDLAAQLRRLACQHLHRRQRDAQEDRLEAGDPAAAGHRPRRGGEVGLGDGGALEQRLGVPDEHERGVGQPHAAAGTLEQRHARLALEHRELLRDRGGRELERVRDRRDRPALAQLAQQPQPAEIEHREGTLPHHPQKSELFLTLRCSTMPGP